MESLNSAEKILLVSTLNRAIYFVCTYKTSVHSQNRVEISFFPTGILLLNLFQDFYAENHDFTIPDFYAENPCRRLDYSLHGNKRVAIMVSLSRL
jgi:hypothetical protein